MRQRHLAHRIPAASTPERQAELREITAAISRWLDALAPDDRALFIRRYYFGDDLKTLGSCCGQTGKQLSQRMLRLRRRLQSALEQEGITV